MIRGEKLGLVEATTRKINKQQAWHNALPLAKMKLYNCANTFMPSVLANIYSVFCDFLIANILVVLFSEMFLLTFLVQCHSGDLSDLWSSH